MRLKRAILLLPILIAFLFTVWACTNLPTTPTPYEEYEEDVDDSPLYQASLNSSVNNLSENVIHDQGKKSVFKFEGCTETDWACGPITCRITQVCSCQNCSTQDATCSPTCYYTCAETCELTCVDTCQGGSCPMSIKGASSE